jgi:hypothetical protein
MIRYNAAIRTGRVIRHVLTAKLRRSQAGSQVDFDSNDAIFSSHPNYRNASGTLRAVPEGRHAEVWEKTRELVLNSGSSLSIDLGV